MIPILHIPLFPTNPHHEMAEFLGLEIGLRFENVEPDPALAW